MTGLRLSKRRATALPKRPPRPCTVCGRLAATGSRCGLHPIVRPPRPSFRARGYGRTWEATRAALLRRDPMCRECRTERSVVAAHLVPKARGGSDDLTNLPHAIYLARKSRQIMVGKVAVGGDAPISVQTMTNTITSDVAATLEDRTVWSRFGL